MNATNGADPSVQIGPLRQPNPEGVRVQRAFSIALRELAQPRRTVEYAVAGRRGTSTRLDGGALLSGYQLSRDG